jgi:hypothetical protein
MSEMSKMLTEHQVNQDLKLPVRQRKIERKFFWKKEGRREKGMEKRE